MEAKKEAARNAVLATAGVAGIKGNNVVNGPKQAQDPIDEAVEIK